MQVECALLFNGHTRESIDAIDAETMAALQTMYADGLLGNHALLDMQAKLVGAVWNYIRAPGAPPYRAAAILGQANDYLYPPSDEVEQMDGLLLFMSQAPGFNPDLFKG